MKYKTKSLLEKKLFTKNLEPFETRRLKYDKMNKNLKMYYFKIILNLINIDLSEFFQITPADSKTRYKLRKKCTETVNFLILFQTGQLIVGTPSQTN